MTAIGEFHDFHGEVLLCNSRLITELCIHSLLVEDPTFLKESTHVHTNRHSTISECYEIGLGWSGLVEYVQVNHWVLYMVSISS